MTSDESLPLPEDPVLAEWADSLNRSGHWATVFDSRWNSVFTTDDLRRSFGGLKSSAPVLIGEFIFGPAATQLAREKQAEGGWSEALGQEFFVNGAGGLLSVFDRDELREMVDPIYRDLVDELPDAEERSMVAFQAEGSEMWGINLGTWSFIVPIRRVDGSLAGFAMVAKPAAGMAIIGTMAGTSDVRHAERIQRVVSADRRPSAILFADLEASSTLSRRLSTSDYFNLGRRLVRAADDCVVDAGGLVGRHLGDGVTAFFVAEILGSESAAARAAIEASMNLRAAADTIAERSGLEPSELVLRFGLHWGSTVYMGLFKSSARSEVTALGDEVNETARIEACATGGKTLASKDLIERLSRDDVRELGLGGLSYTMLGDFPTATEKAKRDAPSIPVCAI